MFGYVKLEPFMAVLLADAKEQFDEMRKERDYWRDKAEILLDTTLFRKGEVTHHVFSKAPEPRDVDEDNIMERAIRALSITEVAGKQKTP